MLLSTLVQNTLQVATPWIPTPLPFRTTSHGIREGMKSLSEHTMKSIHSTTCSSSMLSAVILSEALLTSSIISLISLTTDIQTLS